MLAASIFNLPMSFNINRVGRIGDLALSLTETIPNGPAGSLQTERHTEVRHLGNPCLLCEQSRAGSSDFEAFLK